MSYGKTLDVLLKFVKRDENEKEVDAAQLIEIECYNTWLESRITKPLNPHEAFRKIITAHCKAEGGMQPFPKDVEKSVLKEIRKSRVWPCFKGTSSKIGLRGFKSKGYWETQRVNPSQKLPISTSLSTISNLSKKENSNLLKDTIERFSEVVSLNTVESKALEEFYNVFSRYFPKELTRLMVLLWYQKGILDSVVPKGMNPRLSETLNFFFSKEFILPSQKERKFLPNRPIGRCFGDLKYCASLDTDLTLKDIYKGDISNTPATELRVFPQQAFLFQEQVLCDFCTVGEGWNRTLEYRFDGQAIILLNRYYRIPNKPNFAFVESQDITDFYLDSNLF